MKKVSNHFFNIGTIMKITLSQLILVILLSGISYANPGFAQDFLNTKVSITLKEVPLVVALEQLEGKSGVRFAYSQEFIQVNTPVSLEARKEKLSSLLTDLLTPLQISYEVIGNQIILKRVGNDPKPSETADIRGQVEKDISIFSDNVKPFTVSESIALNISGRVTNDQGEGIPGVSILLKGTTTGTATDSEGKYALTVPDNQANGTLVFSFIGFSTEEVSIGNRTTVDVQLVPDIKSLSEVVVVGYGTQSKRNVTGAVSTVKAADLTTISTVNLDNALQGKAAGLQVTTYTAQPGGGINVVIRGALSPNGLNQPLYVIDGVPITNNSPTDNFGSGQNDFGGGTDRNPLNTINPNDIESIDILKDASASAIYGSAAANGVVLITTKRGKEGRVTVAYNGSYSIQTRKTYLQPFNATDFMRYHELYGQEAYKYQNQLAPYGQVDPSTVTPYQRRFSDSDIAGAGEGTNWMDYLLRPGSVNDQNVSIAGGAGSTRLYVSLNYFDQKALIQQSGLTRYTGRINLDQKIGGRVLFKLGLTYSHINNQNLNSGQQNIDSPSALQSALRFAPTFGVYDANGALTQSYLIRTPNPQAWLMINDKTQTRRLLLTPNVEVNITDGLKANFVGGLDQNTSDIDRYIPVAARFQTVPTGEALLGTNRINNYSGESYLTYNRTIGQSSLTAVAGVGYYKTTANSFSLNAFDFFTDAFGTADVAIAANRSRNTLASSRSERTKLSQFFRLNYVLLDRYILEFNGRHDGSTTWAPGHQWGFFPGVSAAWQLSEESFMKRFDWLNQLKIRVGYGTVGNEGILGNYALSLYGPSVGWTYPFGNPGQVSTGVLQTQLGNPELSWETDATLNAGVDFGLFKNRISASVDYFVRTATNLFDFKILPSANPVGRIGANVGSTRSTGIEVALQTQNIKTGKFSWTSNLTFSTYKTFWLTRNPTVTLPSYIGENDPINAVYGWRTDGLIRSSDQIPSYQTGAFVGNVKYVDINNDGKLDINDVQYLGNTDPKAYYGLNNTFNYGNFDLSVFLYGSLGGLQNDQWISLGSLGNSVGIQNPTPANAEVHSANTWASFNPNGSYPGLAADVASQNNPTRTNDFGVRNVNFGRIKNVTLGYTLPTAREGGRKFVRSVRIYGSIQNPLVFGNYSGLDPEMERNNFPYPIAMTTTFGLNVQF
jgi:TonB-linked SusC/RagA family outer membrane protein